MRLTLIIDDSGVYVERGASRKTLIKDTFDSVIVRKLANQFPPLPLQIPETTEEFLARGGEITECKSQGELHREEVRARRVEAATIDLEKLGILDDLTI